MRKKIVLLVLGCIVVLGLNAVPASAVNIIFSDDFNVFALDPYVPPAWSGRLPIYWDLFCEDYYLAWFDVGYETRPEDPCFVPNPNDRKMLLGQSGVDGISDAWMITKDYYDVSSCTRLDVNLVGMFEEPNTRIIAPIIKVKVLYYNNSHNLVGEAEATIADNNTPRVTWIDMGATVTVPAGATLAQFEVYNDSIGGGHGTLWFDNFTVTDPVCVDRPSMDLNRDCKVSFADLAAFAAQWHSCGLFIQGSVTRCW
jgi:hypothetical protein